MRFKFQKIKYNIIFHLNKWYKLKPNLIKLKTKQKENKV